MKIDEWTRGKQIHLSKHTRQTRLEPMQSRHVIRSTLKKENEIGARLPGAWQSVYHAGTFTVSQSRSEYTFNHMLSSKGEGRFPGDIQILFFLSLSIHFIPTPGARKESVI